MGYAGKAVLAGDAAFEVAGKAFANLDHRAAFAADEVMMVAIIVLPEQFKACSAVAKIEAFYHGHFLQ